MPIAIVSNNLVFDEKDPRCRVTVIAGYAYVEALDLGAEHARYTEPEVKRYVGEWNWHSPEASLRHIIKWGSKWGKLPR